MKQEKKPNEALPPEAEPSQVSTPSEALPPELGGPNGPEPTRYGDWERNGRCIDF